jgi:hypothetical protein
MIKNILIIVIFLAAGLSVYSCNNSTTPNTQANLKGVVIDTSSLNPLKDVKVGITSTNIFTYTDSNGFFRFGVPVSDNTTRVNINFTIPGFVEKYFSIDIKMNDTLNLGNVYLKH